MSHCFTLETPVERVFAEIAREIELGLYVYQLDDVDDPGSLRLVYANPASAVATGVGLDAVIGRPLREAFPELLATGLPAVFLEIANGGAARDLGEVEYGDERVTTQTFSVRAFPLPQQTVGVSFTNFTPLRAAEQRAVETLESMSDAFFTLDSDWRFTYLNPQTELILDRPREELVGRDMWEAFPGAADSPFFDAYQRAMHDRVPVQIEETYEPLGRTLEVRLYPVSDGLAVYFRDVTSARLLEGQVRQGQRLEAIGGVTAGLAHDFNNLLTVIGGFANLGSAAAVDETSVTYFAEIETASRKAAGLIRQLLAFGGQQSLSPTVLDLNEVVDGFSSLLRHLLPADVELRLEPAPQPVPGYVDQTQLEQVLLNLVVNSRDAIGGTGSVTIRTATEAPADFVHDVDVPSGWLQVEDTGAGIAADVRPHIFDPFFSTKPPGLGSGLGLATIYGIVTQSGGSIFVDSAAGAGTTMTVALPAHPRSVGSSREGEHAARPPAAE